MAKHSLIQDRVVDLKFKKQWDNAAAGRVFRVRRLHRVRRQGPHGAHMVPRGKPCGSAGPRDEGAPQVCLSRSDSPANARVPRAHAVALSRCGGGNRHARAYVACGGRKRLGLTGKRRNDNLAGLGSSRVRLCASRPYDLSRGPVATCDDHELQVNIPTRTPSPCCFVVVRNGRPEARCFSGYLAVQKTARRVPVRDGHRRPYAWRQ